MYTHIWLSSWRSEWDPCNIISGIGPGGYDILANIISCVAWVRHGWLLAMMMPSAMLLLVWMVLEGCLGPIFENLLHKDYFAGIDVMGAKFGFVYT